MSLRLEGKVAIVTGGASGIGYATVERLAEEGASVLLTDWNEAGGVAAAERLTRQGRQVEFRRHDAGDQSDWEGVVAHAVARFGALHILVNNAYSAGGGFIERLTTQDLRDAMRVNVEGTVIGMRLGAEAMRQGGSIINLASIAALVGSDSNASYGAAKAAVVSLTKSAAVGFARRKPPVRVNAVAPGYIHTPALETAIRGMARMAKDAEVGPELEQFAGKVPLGRVGQPREIANTILFLASDEASYMTGQCLVVDGGTLLTA